MPETLIAGIMAFAGTNIDDIFINMIFFAQADTKRKLREVWLGKYLGIGALVLTSLLGAYFLHAVPQEYIGLLGWIPIALGIWEWVSYIKKRKLSESEEAPEAREASGGMTISVALVTASNGADNIGVYMPLFAGYTAAQIITVIVVFAVMIALWCWLGKKLSDLPILRDFLTKYKCLIVPVVLVALGVYIMVKSMI